MYFNYVRENSDQFYTILQVPYQGILTQVLYCMAKEDDCTMRDTDKAQVITLLEEEYQSVAPSRVDTAVIGGMFLVRLISLISIKYYSDFVRMLLVKVMKMATVRVDIVFDIYKSPSPKDMERDVRGDYKRREFAVGPGQKIPWDFSELLCLMFKSELLKFSSTEYGSRKYGEIIGSKKVYISINNYCELFQCVNGWLVM